MMNPDYFNVYECTLTVTDLERSPQTIIRLETVVAPRLVHEQRFLDLVKQVYSATRHLEVKISRTVYVDGRNDPLILDVTYQNHQ